jgi:hypothetical protein
MQCAGAADSVVEQLARHRIANTQVVERRAVTYVAAVEEHFACIRQTDEAIALPTDSLAIRPVAW